MRLQHSTRYVQQHLANHLTPKLTQTLTHNLPKFTRPLALSLLLGLIILLANLPVQNAYAATTSSNSTTSTTSELTTPKIIKQTTEALPNCLNWKLIGECFWLKCNLFGCKIVVTPKVGHYRPDLVVSVYPTIDSHPWKEIKKLTKQSFKPIKKLLPKHLRNALTSQGTDPATNPTTFSRNTRFFEADVIGHPLQNLSFKGADFFCESTTRPLKFHYSSLLDIVAWRNPEFEVWNIKQFSPGKREIGNFPTFTWGSVYPRSGWVNQPSPPKATAVIAQRASDIAINGGKARVRKRLTNTTRSNQWPPPSLREANGATGKFQMLHPVKSKSCKAFGTNDLTTLADWGGDKTDVKNSYMWTLWRPYKCCPKGGQTFLGSDDVKGYP
ncbi:MAG: TIGR03756 family integrating conjugative element protein [Gammaproteobacteria bacterium]|nr:TIGR03756 family integrating conjugative element protein [Gammaproteobacteria bacterium]MDE0252722.1 TIGR03756 family integrating conjugative element protein [Gammaproteobacteria bacterium]MDE0402410.1 TIGR03756 family integrating conjugative element protein [Gammaproteobacteria bacterium]